MQTEDINITGSSTTGAQDDRSLASDRSGAPLAARQRRQLPKIDMGNVLLAMLIVAGIGGVYLLKLRSGPAEASAEQVRTQSKVDRALLLLKKSGGLSRMAEKTRDVVVKLRCEAKNRQIPIGLLARNPFALQAEASAYATGEDDQALAALTVTDADKAEALTAARALKLQSVLVGPGGGTAMINDRPVSVGDRVAGWTVEEIRGSEVVLTWQDLKYVLKVKMPT
jgi:hypothetical protein